MVQRAGERRQYNGGGNGTHGKGRDQVKRIYDWNRWLGSGRRSARVVLRHGRHYKCSQSSFGQQIRNAAARLGVAVRIHDHRTRFVVEILEPAGV